MSCIICWRYNYIIHVSIIQQQYMLNGKTLYITNHVETNKVVDKMHCSVFHFFHDL